MFARSVDASALGTAVKAHKLDLFDRLGELVCAREVSAANPSRDPARTAEDTYAAEQGRHYPMRTAFEDHWDGGRQFVYFALLLEGLAPPDYGDYTLIVDPARCTVSALACFPGNTAERYAPTGTLQVTACEAEASAWADRGRMLVCKHASSTLPPESSWAAMVCSASDFSEGVVGGAIPVSAVVQIRIDALHLRDWSRLRIRFLNREPLTAEQEQRVRMLELVERWRDDGAAIVGI